MPKHKVWAPREGRCFVTVYREDTNFSFPCGEPVVEGSKFCAHHEAERVRLTP